MALGVSRESASAIQVRRLMVSTAAMAILWAGASPAFAQDAAPGTPTTTQPKDEVITEQVTPGASSAEAPPPTDSTIVVTGSRIARKDYEANSPIVTVNETLLDNSSTAAIERNLNKLPQFTPAQTPQLGGDIQPTATNTPGAATISLRGIGSNRNLVLIDGRRGTPANASGVIDINTIPQAAIERIETISGGASATYGADAVAGVTNFILKKNFRGLQLDAQTGISSRGDGLEWQVSGIMGSDFEDGRGNVSLALSVNTREADYQRNRPWFRDLWRNPSIAGTGFFIDRPGINWGLNAPSPAAINQVMPGANPPLSGIFQTFYTNPDGSVFSGTDFGSRGGVAFFDAPTNGFPYKVTANGVLSENDTYLYNTFPLTRYNAFARGNYEINDWIGVFGQALFSKVQTRTRNEPGPIFAGWGVNVPWGSGPYVGSGSLIGAGNPSSVVLNGMNGYVDPTPGNLADNPTNPAFRTLYGGQFACANNPNGGCSNTTLFQAVIPQDLQTLLNSRPDPNAPFTFTALMPELRETFTDVLTFNLTAGLQGKIPDTDFTWEIFGSHGESHTFARQTGVYSLSRVRTLLTAPNFGQGFTQKGNVEQGGFGASTGTCTTGIDFFGDVGATSEDCLEAIRADLKNRTKVTQTIWEANLQGTLATLPAGDLGVALGASYRKLDFEFLNDTLTTQGRSFQDQALGIYPSGNAFGTIIAKEIYGEASIPLLHDLPAIRNLTLEIGGRISDYNTTGTSYTYKVLGDWEVTDWARFRGGYNRAERSPNVGELYLAAQQSFGVNNVGDVCSRANPSTFSANPATNPNAANVEQVCRLLMDASGDPNAKGFFYSQPQSNATFGFAFPTTVGNPNLKPETADTWTAGIVLKAPTDSPWFRRTRLSVDYFDIKVSDAIGVQSIGVAQLQCFDAGFNPDIATNPSAAVNNPFCQNITRNAQNGGLGDVKVTYVNNGRFRVRGIDAQLDWAADIGPGTLSANVLFNYMLDFKASELPTRPLVEYVGTLGTAINGLNTQSAYEWKLFSTLNYRVGGFNIGLQWQHLPSVEDAASAELGIDTPTTGAPSYDLFHLNMNYAFNQDITFRFGVDNLFDKKPPLTGINVANNNPAVNGLLPGGTLGGQLGGGFYDLEGRRFWAGVSAKF